MSILRAGLLGLVTLALTQEPPPKPAPKPPPPAPVETVRESATKVEYPVRRSAPGGEQWLLGTAVRTKTIFDVNVYAYGLYADPYLAQEVLAPFKELPIRELEKRSDFYTQLASGRIPLTMRLVFARNVDGDDVREAFEDSLAPRIVYAKERLEKGDASEALATFRGCFTIDKLKQGAEIVFSWQAGDRLEVSVAGEAKPALISPGLCWALFDVYLGKDPIETSGKRKLISQVPALLAAKLPPKPEPEPKPEPKPEDK